MRSELEMLELIVEIARRDARVRAVIMNGSRANPDSPGDIFQDFDIVYLVTEVEPFKYNPEWINQFGELMILQMPEDMQDPPPGNHGGFVYLMQLRDGNRIDLGIFPVGKVGEIIRDSLTVILLDKDGIVPPLAPPNERDYLPSPPTSKQFSDCCNEFWWVCPYAAKGLWREQILYAKTMLDWFIRDQLVKMITWYIGMKTGFSVNPGKFGKHFQQHLEPELWEMLLKTYADAGYDHTWDALFMMGNLFRKVAIPVAERFGFDYPYEDDERVSAHLKHVRTLPKDANKIY